MELFREDGCLTDEGLQALVESRLDELGRLEAAEHLSYCTKCLDRYTALLTGDKLVAPPRPGQKAGVVQKAQQAVSGFLNGFAAQGGADTD